MRRTSTCWSRDQATCDHWPAGRWSAPTRGSDAAERDPIALHRARTAAKRARYAAEVVGKPKLARRLKRRTEGLGIHHDCHVASARLLSLDVTGDEAEERDRILTSLAARAEDGRLLAIGSL
nr:CHAD domain-containing protein [Nocardioides sp. B-3]